MSKASKTSREMLASPNMLSMVTDPIASVIFIKVVDTLYNEMISLNFQKAKLQIFTSISADSEISCDFKNLKI